ncbi:hypothetical protein ANO11243_084750 [Dothideomycetidae sp. 11243]|nr:hypothetical protein ANO11243_084750 [fungal sp. No.11243]
MKQFHLFPLLPAELRHQIWRHALPELGPALLTYEEGLWCKECPTSRILRVMRNRNAYTSFRYDLLDDAHVRLPVAFVNKEARAIALRWCRKHDVVQYRSSFKRTFNPRLDALYAPLNTMSRVLDEPWELPWKDPIWREDEYSHMHNLWNFALPEFCLFDEDNESIFAVTKTYGSTLVYIIVDAPMALQKGLQDVYRPRQRWEIEILPGGSLIFEREANTITPKGRNSSDHDKVYDRIEATLTARLEKLHVLAPSTLEIQPAMAVMK